MYTDRSTYTFTIVNKHNRINTNLSHHIVPSIRRQKSDRCCTYYILFDCGFSNDSNTDTRCGSVGRFERIFLDLRSKEEVTKRKLQFGTHVRTINQIPWKLVVKYVCQS